MTFFTLVRDRWLTIYPYAVLVSFGLGLLLKAHLKVSSAIHATSIIQGLSAEVQRG
jgi:hypothetical protein